MMFYLLPAFALMLAASPAFATSVEEALAGCHPTPEFEQKDYPGEDVLNKNNNLRRQTGSSFKAAGTPIFFKGKVLNEKCQPVTGAKVDMWQVDSEGKNVTPDQGEDFLGSGRTYTNNLGEYAFITVLPGKTGKSAAHVNLTVIADGFTQLSTRVYFPDNPDNDSDAEFKKITPASNILAVEYKQPGHDDMYLYNIRLIAQTEEEKSAADENAGYNQNEDTQESVGTLGDSEPVKAEDGGKEDTGKEDAGKEVSKDAITEPTVTEPKTDEPAPATETPAEPKAEAPAAPTAPKVEAPVAPTTEAPVAPKPEAPKLEAPVAPTPPAPPVPAEKPAEGAAQ